MESLDLLRGQDVISRIPQSALQTNQLFLRLLLARLSRSLARQHASVAQFLFITLVTVS